MIRVESRLHHQTATIPEPNFYRGVASSWLGCCSRYLHLNKLLRLRLAQPFSPGKETLPAQPALAAKRSYSLPASGLLGDEPLPFLPCLFATLFFGRPTRLLSRAHVSKMGFGYRSRNLLKFDESGGFDSLNFIYRIQRTPTLPISF